MHSVRASLFLFVFLFLSAAPAIAQTHKEFGTWGYVESGDYEAAHTESMDPDRTFSLEVICEDDELKVALSFLVASPADDIGLDPDRFVPNGEIEAWLDGEEMDRASWSFSTSSEVFVNQQPAVFLAALEKADRMQVEVRDTEGDPVGTFTFSPMGLGSLLDTLSCYQDGAQDDEVSQSERPNGAR